jgi:Uncharacterized conserved protein
VPPNYLFVYGTLRRACNHALLKEIDRYADFVSTATYQGKLFLIDTYPGAVPSLNPNNQIQGEVYCLTNENRLLDLLDDYEECSPKFPSPAEYYRSLQNIQLINHQPVDAWIYLYNHKTHNLKLIMSGNFLDTLV